MQGSTLVPVFINDILSCRIAQVRNKGIILLFVLSYTKEPPTSLWISAPFWVCWPGCGASCFLLSLGVWRAATANGGGVLVFTAEDASEKYS